MGEIHSTQIYFSLEESHLEEIVVYYITVIIIFEQIAYSNGQQTQNRKHVSHKYRRKCPQQEFISKALGLIKAYDISSPLFIPDSQSKFSH